MLDMSYIQISPVVLSCYFVLILARLIHRKIAASNMLCYNIYYQNVRTMSIVVKQLYPYLFNWTYKNTDMCIIVNILQLCNLLCMRIHKKGSWYMLSAMKPKRPIPNKWKCHSIAAMVYSTMLPFHLLGWYHTAAHNKRSVLIIIRVLSLQWIPTRHNNSDNPRYFMFLNNYLITVLCACARTLQLHVSYIHRTRTWS